MIVTDILIDGYKNLHNISISPHPKYNLIIGMNAQGKTNILEAVWILTGCKSFRGSKEKDYIGFNQQNMNITLRFKDNLREQKITYSLSKLNLKDKKITLNDVPLKHSQKLFESFKCVVFTPDDIDIVKGPPEKRRSFIDLAYSQISHKSLRYIRAYDTIISQRNAAIKDIINGRYSENVLVIWDQQLADICTFVSVMRHKYIRKLNDVCRELYSKITDGSEILSVSYAPNAFTLKELDEGVSAQMSKDCFIKLHDNAKDDIRVGYTQMGIHRDDVIFKINNLNVKEFGSQGQKKSTALVLKLAQAQLLYDYCHEPPVILLDDVMGELDVNRQNLVYDVVQDMQVFITSCNENAVEFHEKAKTFTVKNGSLV